MKSIPLLFLVVGITTALHDVAPGEQACGTMTPQHGPPPQNGNSPYRIILSSTKTAGQPIDITLVAPSQGPKMRGFFIQVRPVGGEAPAGQFNPNSDPQAKPVTCGGKDNVAMTHRDNSDKEQVKLKWTPPQEDGEYDVFVTFVQQQSTFWVKQSPDGEKITVSHGMDGKAVQPKPNSGVPSNASTSGNSSSQPPSEGGASANIPLWSGISVAAATAVISFFRLTHFRLL